MKIKENLQESIHDRVSLVNCSNSFSKARLCRVHIFLEITGQQFWDTSSHNCFCVRLPLASRRISLDVFLKIGLLKNCKVPRKIPAGESFFSLPDRCFPRIFKKRSEKLFHRIFVSCLWNISGVFWNYTFFFYSVREPATGLALKVS